jgi:hypothetical protein
MFFLQRVSQIDQRRRIQTTQYHLPNLSLRDKCHLSHRNVCELSATLRPRVFLRNVATPLAVAPSRAEQILAVPFYLWDRIPYIASTSANVYRYNTATKQVCNCSTETSYCHAVESLSKPHTKWKTLSFHKISKHHAVKVYGGVDEKLHVPQL